MSLEKLKTSRKIEEGESTRALSEMPTAITLNRQINWFDGRERPARNKSDKKYKKVLNSKTFMKNSDRRGDAKFFQLGTVMDSSDDFYNRLTKKQRKANLVDELLADSEFRALQKKRKAKMSAQAMENRGNPTKKKARKIKTLLSWIITYRVLLLFDTHCETIQKGDVNLK